MIKSFANRETEELWRDGKSRRLPPEIARRAFAKLQFLHATADVQVMKLSPGSRLEKLTGDLAGFWSVRINIRWRLIFRFENHHAYDVEIIDYH